MSKPVLVTSDMMREREADPKFWLARLMLQALEMWPIQLELFTEAEVDLRYLSGLGTMERYP